MSGIEFSIIRTKKISAESTLPGSRTNVNAKAVTRGKFLHAATGNSLPPPPPPPPPTPPVIQSLSEPGIER